jgi:hypothetical protein
MRGLVARALVPGEVSLRCPLRARVCFFSHSPTPRRRRGDGGGGARIPTRDSAEKVGWVPDQAFCASAAGHAPGSPRTRSPAKPKRHNCVRRQEERAALHSRPGRPSLPSTHRHRMCLYCVLAQELCV